MLSFELVEGGKAIQIECDRVGMAILLKTLGALVGDAASHRHLRSPGCGGSELSETTPRGRPAIGEVIIDYVEGD